MDPLFIDLGFIQIYWYSVMILLAVITASLIIIKESKRYKLPKDYVTNLITYALIFGIIGARIYYVIFEWNYYSKHLIDIFKVWEGGLAIHGGLISGLLFIIYYTKKYKVNTLRFLDIIVPAVIIAQAIGRWGNFFNGEAHGSIVTLEFLTSLHLPKFIIDGMNIYGIYYHPTFLYESVLCFIGFIIMIIFRRFKNVKIGQVTAFYMIWYGVVRFFIEKLRTDSLMLLDFKIAQIVSIILIILGILLMILRMNKEKYNDLEKLDNIKF